MTRGRVLFLHPSLRERASACRSVSCVVWRFRELFLRWEGLSVQWRGLSWPCGRSPAHDREGRCGDAVFMPGKAGSRRGQGRRIRSPVGWKRFRDGGCARASGGGAEGASEREGLEGKAGISGASCAARVFCGLCALRRLPGAFFAPDRRLSGRFSARFGRARGAEGQRSGHVLRS